MNGKWEKYEKMNEKWEVKDEIKTRSKHTKVITAPSHTL